MARKGRGLETLVATIEGALERSDIEIKSPDLIVGRQSGMQREVDVSLRGKVGTADLLVIIECRDRAGKQGVDWIEQLASKRDDVGAQVAMAVSASGFTRGALKLAESRQVLLRNLKEVNGDTLRDLFRIEDAAFVVKRFELTDLYLVDSETETGGDMPTALERPKSFAMNTTIPIFGFGDHGPSMTVRDIESQVKAGLNPYADLDDHLPENLPPAGTELTVLQKSGTVLCKLTSHRGPAYFYGADGRRPIKGVAVTFRSWVQVGRMSVEKWRSYVGQNATIAYAASGNVNFGIPQRADLILEDPNSQSGVLRVYDSDDPAPV